MGNCMADDPKTDKNASDEPRLREMNTIQTNPNPPQQSVRTGPYLMTDGGPSQMPHPHYPPGGHPPMIHPGYHPSGALPATYAGPLLLMDPYTGATYAYDQEAYEAFMESERRHRRRETRKSRHEEDGADENVTQKDDDRSWHRSRQHSSKTAATSSGGQAPKRQPKSASTTPHDVIISYSRQNGPTMKQIKDKLEAKGITVWVDTTSIEAGQDFLSKIGEAIIDAKLFVCILSEQAVTSKYFRDEVALAYVSNTAIFPVNIMPKDELLPFMDTGLKLQLSNYKWTSLTDPSTMDNNIDELVTSMKAELDDLRGQGGSDRLSPQAPSSPVEVNGGERATSPTDVNIGGGGEPGSPTSNNSQPAFNNPVRLRERNRAVTSEGDDVMPEQFWSKNFSSSDYVMWDRFVESFLSEFKGPVEKTFSKDDQQQLIDILKREAEVDERDRIFKYQFLTFCSPHGEHIPVWQRVYEQARESFAMKEVFNMDSSVRVEAIENLGKFRSAAVIDALRDLLSDPDANVRAVATISLARTDAQDPVTIRHIMRMLTDKDRLVREAGCLALGHLKARQAISKLTHIWRNDVISHVREAASAALHQIGGPEVEDAMRVTKVLAEEIRTLTEMPS